MVYDQALRFANKGYTPLEAAEIIELSTELGLKWYNRGYHGTLHHDVRAVYTKELGIWDGDPVSRHPYPPVECEKRFVDLIGADKILADAHEQMGYQTEGQQWRGIFLTAAKELRGGATSAAFATASPDTILAIRSTSSSTSPPST